MLYKQTKIKNLLKLYISKNLRDLYIRNYYIAEYKLILLKNFIKKLYKLIVNSLHLIKNFNITYRIAINNLY